MFLKSRKPGLALTVVSMVSLVSLHLLMWKLLLLYHRSFVWCAFYIWWFSLWSFTRYALIPCHYKSTSEMFLCLNFRSSRRWLFSGCQGLSSGVKMSEREAHLSLASNTVTVCTEAALHFWTLLRVYLETLRETFGELCCILHKDRSVLFQEMCSKI